MIANITSTLWNVLESAMTMFDNLLSSFGFSLLEFVLAFVLIGAIMKYLVSPYLSGSSDKANVKNNKK